MLIEQGTNYIELEISSPAPGSKARRASVGLGSGDFQAVRAEVWLEPGEFEGFLQDLRDLEKNRKGKASLSAEDAREFQVAIATIDKSGHLEVTARLSQEGREASASLECRFGLDPSALPRVLREFEIIAAAA
jgi:hypothetical protein